jgi:hypothetical protein
VDLYFLGAFFCPQGRAKKPGFPLQVLGFARMHGRAAILRKQNRDQPMQILWAFHSNAPEDGRFPIDIVL